MFWKKPQLWPREALYEKKISYWTTPIAQNHTPVSLKEKMDAYEKEIVKETFLKFDGNRRKAAEELGISKTNLFEKIHKYGIDEKMTGEDA